MHQLCQEDKWAQYHPVTMKAREGKEREVILLLQILQHQWEIIRIILFGVNGLYLMQHYATPVALCCAREEMKSQA
jgi:hypothetical protein